ncbi:MAG: RusA family crossover junction endodeoxyribonuclease [Spirochaetes bacterium]|nr:RusA family crossover junction endodeoxyribonuclease [Spirochaetota bacterium]
MRWKIVTSFFVSGTPKGQPRPRACIRGKHAGVYDPGTADAWRHGDVLRPLTPIAEPVRVDIEFRMPAQKKNARTSPGQRTHSMKKPDIDNATKVVLDALTDAKFWVDDAQVVQLTAIKVAARQVPGAYICVYKVTP